MDLSGWCTEFSSVHHASQTDSEDRDTHLSERRLSEGASSEKRRKDTENMAAKSSTVLYRIFTKKQKTKTELNPNKLKARK